MPIPAFDQILNVLPPHLGDAQQKADHSPYPCTMPELCRRFGTSDSRRDILEGFLGLRSKLFDMGLRGFQWLDGIFLENIEAQANRDPGDIDVVTFVADPLGRHELEKLIGENSWLRKPNELKRTYHVHHFLLPLGTEPRLLVEFVCYWYGLFSHRRDGLWKGMLTVDLEDRSEDTAATKLLGNMS